MEIVFLPLLNPKFWALASFTEATRMPGRIANTISWGRINKYGAEIRLWASKDTFRAVWGVVAKDEEARMKRSQWVAQLLKSEHQKDKNHSRSEQRMSEKPRARDRTALGQHHRAVTGWQCAGSWGHRRRGWCPASVRACGPCCSFSQRIVKCRVGFLK